MSYYIIPTDPNLIDELEFQEYSRMLKNRLNEVGYYETTPKEAKLCIEFSYYYGEAKEIETITTTSTSNYSTTNNKLNGKTQTSTKETNKTNKTKFRNQPNLQANATSKTNINSKTTKQSISNSTTTTKTRYEIPIGCFILAKDNITSKNIWQVEVKDNIPDYYAKNTSLHSLMPWMLLSAQNYFGTSDESQVKIDKKTGVEIKGLKWPYSL